MNDRRLKTYFNFEEADLLANRNGRLSEKQKKRLMADARLEQKSARESAMIVFTVGAAGMATGLLIVVNAPTLAGQIIVGLLLCVVWPGVWGWKAWTVMRSSDPAGEDQIRAARGRVDVVKYEDANGSVDYVLRVDGIEFDLVNKPSGVIADGEECILYFLEKTEEILSVEILPDTK